MSKLCPLKAAAVQQQYQAERKNADYDDVALEMAQHLFGECDREKCQMWCSFTKEFAAKHGLGSGWCGLVNDDE